MKKTDTAKPEYFISPSVSAIASLTYGSTGNNAASRGRPRNSSKISRTASRPCPGIIRAKFSTICCACIGVRIVGTFKGLIRSDSSSPTTLSRASARESDEPVLEAAVHNSRGNAYAARGAHVEAATAYETSARLAQAAAEKGLYANASANAVRARIQADELDAAAGRIVALEAEVIALSDSSAKARVFVHLGRSREQLAERRPEDAAAQRIAAGKDYDAGRAAAERIGDRRIASYALGYLGALYEREGRGAEAADLTRRALFAAQEARAPEALYLWQWQLARIRAADLDVEGAIEAYRGAVATLDQLRNEAALSPTGAGRDFESSVKPVYFGLVDLLLQRAAATQLCYLRVVTGRSAPEECQQKENPGKPAWENFALFCPILHPVHRIGTI